MKMWEEKTIYTSGGNKLSGRIRIRRKFASMGTELIRSKRVGTERLIGAIGP